jgi:hypothetical protein
MRIWNGIIREVRLGPAGRSAWITCPKGGIPAPGQYVLGWSPADDQAALATGLFPAQIGEGGFLTVVPIPDIWEPRTELILQGPSGHGFKLPEFTRHLVLGCFSANAERLLAMLPEALARGCEVVVCADCPLPVLPVEVEIQQFNQLGEVISWADFLIFDLPAIELEKLRSILQGRSIPAGQALLVTAMPCGGQAHCGVCAIQGSIHPMLACKEGPVFPLNQLIESR